MNIKELETQCNYYLAFFEIEKSQLIEKSYSDLLSEKRKVISEK